MTYNGDGLRVRKDDSTGSTKFVWDDAVLLQETDALGDTKAQYLNEPGGYGGLLTQRRGSTSSHYHFDGIGSVERLTDSVGTSVAVYIYSGFGELLLATGTTNAYRFIGRFGYYCDLTDSQYYIRARYYSPARARFQSRDPLYRSTASYEYASGNPVRAVDPAGLWTSYVEIDPRPFATLCGGFTSYYYVQPEGDEWKNKNLYFIQYVDKREVLVACKQGDLCCGPDYTTFEKDDDCCFIEFFAFEKNVRDLQRSGQYPNACCSRLGVKTRDNRFWIVDDRAGILPDILKNLSTTVECGLSSIDTGCPVTKVPCDESNFTNTSLPSILTLLTGVVGYFSLDVLYTNTFKLRMMYDCCNSMKWNTESLIVAVGGGPLVPDNKVEHCSTLV
jgi:RHS repeat-associated protein